MRTGFPVHLVAVIHFEVENVLFSKSVRPLCKGWHRGVVQNNERWTPCGPMECVRVAIECISGICVSYNSLPLTHLLPPTSQNEHTLTRLRFAFCRGLRREAG